VTLARFTPNLKWSEGNGQLTSQAQRILRDLLDHAQKVTGPFLLPSYTVLGVPAASDYEGALIYVSDEAGGKTLAFSDGTNWRRVQDRAIIS
jgi:hypothetical protein